MLRAFMLSAGSLALVALLVAGFADEGRVTALGAGARAGAGRPHSRTLAGPRIPPPPVPSDQTKHASPAMPRLLEGETRTTLGGDDINDAIATYGIDEGGNLYEVHSPQTEVPSLGGPKT